MKVIPALLLLAGTALAVPAGPEAVSRAEGDLVVAPDGTHADLAGALADAEPGDTIEVVGGTHPGPVTIDKPVRVLARDDARIDGGGRGTVVTIEADGAELSGFTVHGSGRLHHKGDSGVRIHASDVTVSEVTIEDTLFGIWVEQADRARLVDNTIQGVSKIPLPERGDGIRVWYSRGVEVTGNNVRDSRDMVFWYSENLTMVANTVEDSRYGIHMMYSHGAIIRENRLVGNSVGAYIMYARTVHVASNLFQENRGASGYGLAFKESSDVQATDNLLVRNGAGLYLDNTPFTPGSPARFHGNALVHNDAGALILPSVTGASFLENTVLHNVVQVEVHGSGSISDNEWRGNHWSDYTGFDRDGDGIGEVPYRSQRLFDLLTQREPELKGLRYGPVVPILEFASHAFPLIAPRPKVVDPAPRISPGPPPVEASAAASAPGGMAVGAVAVLGLALLALAPTATRARVRSAPRAPAPLRAQRTDEAALVDIARLSKRFGRTRVLDGVSLSAKAGEAIALWGPNGAGKTTFLKAILGTVRYGGTISVAGHDPSTQGKATRMHIGYVPQHACLPDWRCAAVIDHFARIKGASTQQGDRLVERLGLEPHLQKRVTQLSGGLRQRLALMLALLSDPPVLLLDEPTSSLDATARYEYLETIQALAAEGKLVIFSSHRIEEVQMLADRVLILDQNGAGGIRTPAELAAVLDAMRGIRVTVEAGRMEEALQALAHENLDVAANGAILAVQGAQEQRRQVLRCLQVAGVRVMDLEERDSPWT